MRSIDLDVQCWTKEQIAIFESLGNCRVNTDLERYVPAFVQRPVSNEPVAMVRDHFIRSKYVQRLFASDNPANKSPIDHIGTFNMPEPLRRGFLYKANEKAVWQKRFFVLQGKYFSYFKELTDSYAKGTIDCSYVCGRMSLATPTHPLSAGPMRILWRAE